MLIFEVPSAGLPQGGSPGDAGSVANEERCNQSPPPPVPLLANMALAIAREQAQGWGWLSRNCDAKLGTVAAHQPSTCSKSRTFLRQRHVFNSWMPLWGMRPYSARGLSATQMLDTPMPVRCLHEQNGMVPSFAVPTRPPRRFMGLLSCGLQERMAECSIHWAVVN